MIIVIVAEREDKREESREKQREKYGGRERRKRERRKDERKREGEEREAEMRERERVVWRALVAPHFLYQALLFCI